MIPTTHSFVIREWRPYSKKTLVGFLSIELPSGLVLHDLTLHERDGSRWIGMPAREYQNSNNEKSWIPTVEFSSKESRTRFQEATLAAFDAYMAEAGS